MNLFSRVILVIPSIRMDNEFVLKGFQSLSDMTVVVCTILHCINTMLDTAE